MGILGGSVVVWASVASAEPIRVHVEAGASHALSGEQASQFGGGGEGKATVEVAPTARVGFQAGAGAIVLSKGDANPDRSVAPTSTGAAFLGTLGVRLRAFGEGHAAGPWVDANGGVARTGDVSRPAFDAHLGWDIRVSETSRLDVGPYLGFTEIFHPDSGVRTSDARLVTVGIQIGLGAKERPHAAPPPPAEAPVAPAPEPVVAVVVDHDRDGDVEAANACPQSAPAWDDGCVGDMHIFQNKIYLDDVIHFDFGNAHIRGDSFRTVKRLAQFLNDHAEITDVEIEGHADEIGTDEYNQALSVDRATAMRELLVWFGAPAARLHIVGYGKTRPKIATQKSEEQNRRVELFVTTTRSQPAPRSGVAATGAHGQNSP